MIMHLVISCEYAVRNPFSFEHLLVEKFGNFRTIACHISDIVCKTYFIYQTLRINGAQSGLISSFV